MIASFHIADLRPRQALRLLRHPPDAGAVCGLRFAATTMTGPLSATLPPPVRPTRIGLIAFWDQEAELDKFLAEHPVAADLAHGWHVRLEPVRHVGALHELADLPTGAPLEPGDPAAVLTLGRPRFNRLLPFMRTNATAAGLAMADPALVVATGFARPPGLLGTFSLWRSTTAMRHYATGRTGPAHRDAILADRARPFTHEKMFIRMRPYAAVGHWDGREPLAIAKTTDHDNIDPSENSIHGVGLGKRPLPARTGQGKGGPQAHREATRSALSVKRPPVNRVHSCCPR